VGSKGWPSRLVGEPGDVVVGLIELCDGLGSHELFGCDMEAVDIALDRLAEPASGIVELPLAERGASSRARIWCSVSVGVWGETVSGRITICGSPSPARDRVRRNVVELTELPTGQPGRPSKALSAQQADDVLIKTAADRLHPYIVVSLLTGARTEELRALRWKHVHLEGRDRRQYLGPAVHRGMALGACDG
jgi:integrase